MQGFAAVLAEAALARAISDTADPDEKTAAQRLVADLLVSCPETINELAISPLTAFLSDAGTAPVHASAVARALRRSKRPAHQQLLAAFLTRPDLSLSDIEPFVSPDTAYVLASRSDRPDVLGLVFANLGTCPDNAVLEALAVNAATPPWLRVQTVSRLLNLCGRDTFLPHANRTLCALREHPETLQPVFAALDLPPEALLKLFAHHTQSWTGLTVPQLDRLVTAFAQVLSAEPMPLAWWPDCSRELLLHPSMSADSSQRLVAAVDAVCTPSSDPDLHDWFKELSEAARILSAPNRVAALLECTPPEGFHSLSGWRQAVFVSASAADLMAVLTGPGVHRYSRGLLIENIVRHALLEVCTPELLALLPVASFRKWRTRSHDPLVMDAVFAELMVSRLGADPSAWRMFAELAEAADAEATVGDVAALAATLTGDQ